VSRKVTSVLPDQKLSLKVTFMKRSYDMNSRHYLAGIGGRTSDISPFDHAITARVTLLDGLTTGRREVDSLGSILQVHAAPFAKLDMLKAAINGNFITYIIDAPEIYTGHGRGSTRNIGDRIAEEVKLTSQVYVICSADPRFDKPTASYVEAQLIDTAAELAIPLSNSIRPFGRDGLRRSPDLEQLVQHAMILLWVAGFRRFDEPQNIQPDRPVRVVATRDLHDVLAIEPNELTNPDDAVRQRLVCRDLKAEGYEVGDRFLVLPGADYSYEGKSGLSSHNKLRRQAIEAMGLLERLPDVTDRARLRVGLDCKSAAIAAKLISGEHVGTRAWRPVRCPETGVPS
jgi:ribosome modulation factor